MIKTISFALALLICGRAIAQEMESKEWWQHAVIYQIYPRSFKDSDGDGNGDLQGIISKLEHLKDINVDAIWLSPIFKSPQVDGGYDISDYREIDSMYGTMADFEELVEEAGKLGIKVIMDLVPNHTSDQHQWFLDSLDKVNGKADYYVWRNGTDDGQGGTKPPFNWISVFGKSAWTFNQARQEYYLHQFDPAQPDLNFENPAVLQEFKDIIEFWMEKGVYGFRVDAISHLFEQFKDEPESNSGAAQDEYEFLEHVYTRDQQGTFDTVYEFRKFIDDYSNEKGGDARIMMTESYSDIRLIMKYYQDELGNKLGAHFPFNFDLIGNLNDQVDARDIVSYIQRWFAYMPYGNTPNWVLGNHDNHRLASRIGTDLAKSMIMLTAVMPGVMVTYNGEEIGMENGEVTWEQGKDPSACSTDENRFPSITRDYERTPYHWDDTKNAGFSDADENQLYLPVSEKYTDNNLAKQKAEASSVGNFYQTYKALTLLRRESKSLRHGTWEIHSIGVNVILAFRRYKEEDAIVYVCHMGKTDVTVKVNFSSFGFEPRSSAFKIVASNQKDKIDTTIDLPDNTITLNGFDGYVLRENDGNTLKLSFGLVILMFLRFIL